MSIAGISEVESCEKDSTCKLKNRSTFFIRGFSSTDIPDVSSRSFCVRVAVSASTGPTMWVRGCGAISRGYVDRHGHTHGAIAPSHQSWRYETSITLPLGCFTRPIVCRWSMQEDEA
ncbi:hypothetical protein Naga_100604g1 [Nannochloropsis gaditana]|uniref:Uncharacterized protein n=1 Tax=Nannochloropsis gaditana TaxID=72520 RepID=W7TRV4_9STRA|nr:hypothetical protein Naga_100604g1 [Nannochloropsis gaditana]